MIARRRAAAETAAMQLKRPPVCAFCGREEPETTDHLPPRCIFPQPWPDDLFSVPCCEPCRNAWGGDDEHFRNVLLCAMELENHPRAAMARERMLRSVQRPQGWDYWLRFDDNLVDIDGEPAIPIDARVLRVVERMARGLYYREFGRPLPRTHEVVRPRLDQQGRDLRKAVNTLGIVLEPRIGCGGQFIYGFRMVDGDSGSGFWAGQFFEGPCAFAFLQHIAAERPWLAGESSRRG